MKHLNLDAAEEAGELNAEEDECIYDLLGRFVFGVGAITEEDLRIADLIMRRAEG